MVNPLDKLRLTRKTGAERFSTNETVLTASLVDFWGWAFSDMVENTTRGVLAEYIVALALDITGHGVRSGWSSFDLTTPQGVRVEVKSAAYLQSWSQKRYSEIEFGVTPTQLFDNEHNSYALERKRQADVYVFALLHQKDKATVDPLNLDQWAFYVVPTTLLDREVPTQKNIALGRLIKMKPIETKFEGIALAIQQAYSIES